MYKLFIALPMNDPFFKYMFYACVIGILLNILLIFILLEINKRMRIRT